jgi:ferrous iron transport protein B
MGHPNVGKSVFFTHLTGIDAISSNFAGTTVSYTQGKMLLKESSYTLIDVPGVFSLTTTSEAEEVAQLFLKSQPQAIICVLDATNLQRSLELALELQGYDIPTVYALNFLDVAKEKGIQIQVPLLSQLLNAPVIETVAVKGQGFESLKAALMAIMRSKESCPSCPSSSCASCSLSDTTVYDTAKEITQKVRTTTSPADKKKATLSDWMIRPSTGIPIALLIMALALGIIVGGGKALRAVFFLPLVNGLIIPFFRNVFGSFIPEGLLQNVLIGEYGIFVIGFEWPFALILPYVFLFYVVFSFLEDFGYLPRLSILFDQIMSRLGLQGGSIINIMMGYGCAIPAIIGTRACTTRKERLVVTSLVCFTIPCISQTGALIELISRNSYGLFVPLIGIALLVFIGVAAMAGKILKGNVPPMIIQVPNLLIPNGKTYGKKLLIRMKHFLLEAEGPMLIAVVIAAVFKETGILDFVSVLASPFIQGWLGLPAQATDGLLLGIVRREMSIAPLVGLNLSNLQVLVAALVSLFYLPCLSVFGIIASEFNAKTAVVIALSTTGFAFFIGGVVYQIGNLFL